jgi:hypothetical protein
MRQLPQSKSEIFWVFTWLALQGFGGVLPVAERELVDKKRWYTREEFLEEWAVAQVLPLRTVTFVNGKKVRATWLHTILWLCCSKSKRKCPVGVQRSLSKTSTAMCL